MDNTADQLLHRILEWLEKKEECAAHLRKLVKELEVLRARCNGGECVGSTVSVVGAACLIGAATAATFFTAGAAAPVLGALGAAYVGTGAVISLTTQVIEHFVSGSTMSEADEVAKKSEKIEGEILELIEKLKAERTDTDLPEGEYIAQRIAGAMWGKVHMFKPLGGVLPFIAGAVILNGLLETFAIFSLGKNNKITKSLITFGAQQLALNMGKAGGKAVVKSGTMLVGAIGMVFALSESIDNWKDLVKKNHVTKASQSLRDTAENIEQLSKALRNELALIQTAIEQASQQTNSGQGNNSDQNQQTNNGQGNNSDQNQQTNSGQGNNSDQNQQTNSGQGDDGDKDKRQNNRENEDEQQTDSDQDSDSDLENTGYSLMALLNVRSLVNKSHLISALIRQLRLDVFLTTETWLRHSNFERVLQDACPPDFRFHHQSREEGRGGGVGVQHTNRYGGRQIRFDFITTFEYVAVVLENNEWEVPVVLVNVYYPPGYRRGEFHDFVDDFQMLLDAITNQYDHIIFTGDFNIHMDNGMQSSAIEFHMLLWLWGLELHVDQVTHIGGHTLDLVFTWNVDISNLNVVNPLISDHYMISFRAIPVSPDGKKKLKKKGKKQGKKQEKK